MPVERAVRLYSGDGLEVVLHVSLEPRLVAGKLRGVEEGRLLYEDNAISVYMVARREPAPAGHGYVLAEYYVNMLASTGTPPPFLVTRLMLLLGDALEAMTPEEAAEATAYRICEAWCRDAEEPGDKCLHQCMEREKAAMRRLLAQRRL